MLKSTIKGLRLHQHAGRVGIHWDGIETFYLSTKQAAALAEELALASNQIKNGYHYPSTNIEE